jgi:hypothetical protein
VALVLLGVVLGVAVLEHKKPTPQRKARETHRLAIERPKTVRK